MPYIVPSDFLSLLEKIRQNYITHQGITESELNQAKPLSYLSFPGALDLHIRKKQIEFLQGLLEGLRARFPSFLNQVFPINNTDTERATPNGEQERNIRALLQDFMTVYYLMIAACLFVKNEISQSYNLRYPDQNSNLYRLITQAMAVSSNNHLGNKEYKLIYLTAFQALKKIDLNDLNRSILNPDIDVERWDNFCTFVACQREIYKKAPEYYLPITQLIVPAFNKGAEWIGYSLGYSLAQEASKTTPMLRPITMTTALLVALLNLTQYSSGYWAAASVATAIAQSTTVIFTAGSMGEAIKWLGTGVGYGVGLPLDLTIKVLSAFYQLLKNRLVGDESDARLLNGINITTQRLIMTPYIDVENFKHTQAFSIEIIVSKDKKLWLLLAGEKVAIDLTKIGDESSFIDAAIEQFQCLYQKPKVQTFLAKLEKPAPTTPQERHPVPSLSSPHTLFNTNFAQKKAMATEPRSSITTTIN